MRVITLLTDLTSHAYAGVLHGVILHINPQAVVVDLCHDIPAQDVHAAAFVLWTAYHFFPSDAIHVAVVDPGVGSEQWFIHVAGQALSGLVTAYACASEGTLLALVGSSGFLEIALRNGSTSERLQVARGAQVQVRSSV